MYADNPGTARPRDTDNSALTTYRGQVALVPPETQVELNISRSYGVAIIRQGGGRWEYIKKEPDHFLDQAEADTLCRQMGFTHAMMNSIVNVSISTHIYGYSYDLDFM